MKILVTGGAGFIGSAVIRYILNNTSDYVVNVDKLTYAGNLDSLSSVSGNDNYCFEQVDICNKKEIEHLFSLYKPDIVMHLAAESHVDRSIDGAGVFIETHQDPDNAPSDGPNMVPLDKLDGLLRQLSNIDNLIKN